MDISRIAVSVTAAALVAITASSGIAAADTQATVGRYSTPDSAVALSMSEQTFVVTMRGLLVGKPGNSQSDTTLIEGGKSLCADIDAGATAATFDKQIDDYNLNRAVYRVIIRSSVLTFCPRHESILG